MKKISLSIVIPAFNESQIIEKNIFEVAKWIKKNKKISFEIIVVNDGSTDNTKQILHQIQLKAKYLKAIHHDNNIGRGKAIRTGFDHASGQFIICLDADLSNVVAELHCPATKNNKLVNRHKSIAEYIKKSILIYLKILTLDITRYRTDKITMIC